MFWNLIFLAAAVGDYVKKVKSLSVSKSLRKALGENSKKRSDPAKIINRAGIISYFSQTVILFGFGLTLWVAQRLD